MFVSDSENQCIFPGEKSLIFLFSPFICDSPAVKFLIENLRHSECKVENYLQVNPQRIPSFVAELYARFMWIMLSTRRAFF